MPADKADAYRAAVKAFADKQQTTVAWLQSNPSGPGAKEKFNGFLVELKTPREAMDGIASDVH